MKHKYISTFTSFKPYCVHLVVISHITSFVVKLFTYECNFRYFAFRKYTKRNVEFNLLIKNYIFIYIRFTLKYVYKYKYVGWSPEKQSNTGLKHKIHLFRLILMGCSFFPFNWTY